MPKAFNITTFYIGVSNAVALFENCETALNFMDKDSRFEFKITGTMTVTMEKALTEKKIKYMKQFYAKSSQQRKKKQQHEICVCVTFQMCCEYIDFTILLSCLTIFVLFLLVFTCFDFFFLLFCQIL